MNTLLIALWFFLPAGLANAAPVFASKLPGLRRWQTPMDFGYKYKGKQLLGDNKTWRGLLCGTLVAGLVAAAQYNIWLPPEFAGKSQLFMTILGAAMGLGALCGDALESFFKRQRGIDSGKSWFPFDQTDYIAGGILTSLIFVRLPLTMYLAIIVFYFGLHVFVVFVGYKFGLREQPI